MARRFETFYRVKPRDNLGDPEYWNRRLEDIDRRVYGNETAVEEIGGLTAHVEGIALDRLNLILAPALTKIGLVSEQGFLLAHSSSSVTLTVGATVMFTIEDAAERELFAPSYFLAIVRSDNIDDYAFARRVSYSKVTGELVVVIEQAFGNPGPFIDWEISTSAGVSLAVSAMLDDVLDARDVAVAKAALSTTDRTAAQAARTGAETARTGAEAALASFNTVYLGVRTTNPSSGLIGSFYYNSVEQVFKVLGADGWAPGQSVSFGGVVQQDYTVTNPAGQSTFVVDGGFSKIDVFKNGVQLNPLVDFDEDPATNTVTLTVAAANGSWVSVRGYKEANAVDFYTKAQSDDRLNLKLDKTGGTLSGALTVQANVSSTGDLKASSGFVRLSPTGDRYLQWTGTVYTLAGAGNIWHTGNFDPATKFDKAGGSITGNVSVTANLNAQSMTVGGAGVWHAGNFDPNSKLNAIGGAISGDITVYRPGATNTGAVFLGSGTGRGLYWDGSNYSLLGSGTPWHTGNFDPNGKASLSGAVFTGDVEVRNSLWILTSGVKRARWTIDGSGTLLYQDQGGQNHVFINNVGQIWSQTYGYLHDYIWSVGNERATAYRQSELINCRTVFAGDWDATAYNGQPGISPGEPYGATAAMTGARLNLTINFENGQIQQASFVARFRYLQIQLGSGAWLNFATG